MNIDYNKAIPVGEIYPCVQGEGKYVGIPHLLIRFTGCRLRCQFSGGSFCDTPFASWKPEKGKITYNDILQMYKKYPQISYTMITGGAPTLFPEDLQTLCLLGKSFGHVITIETEGSEFVETEADLISLSPKLSNSTPQPGTWMEYANRKVSEKDREQHEKWRCNYGAMEMLIKHHPDYQFKPVISSKDDLEEIQILQNRLDIPNNNVWLMPEGLMEEQLTERRKWVLELCIKHGYNFSDRLQVVTYGDRRGV